MHGSSHPKQSVRIFIHQELREQAHHVFLNGERLMKSEVDLSRDAQKMVLWKRQSARQFADDADFHAFRNVSSNL